MKTMVFDAGPIISLVMNNLLWTLEPLQNKFNGDFYITEAVKKELTDIPLLSKKFKFEALQVQQYISKGVIKIIPDYKIETQTKKLLDSANHSFVAHNHFIQIVHHGEISVLAASCFLNADATVMDERTSRELVERPNVLADVLSKKLHTPVKINKTNLNMFKENLPAIKIIRSFELVTIAFESGLLDKYLEQDEEKAVPHLKRTLLEGVLWGIKLNGCAVSRSEIDEIINMEEREKRI